MYRGAILAISRWTVPFPPAIWKKQLARIEHFLEKQLEFMTGDHRRVHNFTVSQLIETGCPCRIDEIAANLDLSTERVNNILADFEKHTNLINRDGSGNIMQTYPVTLKKTPLRMVISTGHELFAGEALGVLAIPLTQTRIKRVPVFGHITTACRYCQRSLHILVSSDNTARPVEEQTFPVAFIPALHKKTSLADTAKRFMDESFFFCCMEHAREHRKKTGGKTGVFLPLNQAMTVNQVLQKVILGIEE